MSNVIVKKDGCGIEFLEDDVCFYDLTFDEIYRHGVEFWLNHLSDKTWFCDSVKAQFLSLIK